MHFSLSTANALLLFYFFVSISEAVSTCGRTPEPTPDFDCDGQLITGNRLNGVVCAAKRTAKYNSMLFRKDKQKLYNGPPFMNSYFLLPISLQTKSYQKASSTSYRAVLTKNYRVFSVIMQERNKVKECRMKAEVTEKHRQLDFNCSGQQFHFFELIKAADLACKKILRATNEQFPARYDGNLYEEHGKQRYIFPIYVRGLYDGTQPAGSFRVVINSKCQLIGVLRYDSNSNSQKCLESPSLMFPSLTMGILSR
ncbi:hypothetical protein HI914_07343 [Erysiphe necator]|nr:hypothetical protein HI914_07343 [Erysiphe necator]